MCSCLNNYGIEFFTPVGWIIHESWSDFAKEHSKKLNNILKENGEIKPFYPSAGNVLRFMECDVKKVRCVIVGMDPYCTNTNGIPDATGRAFELQNIDEWTTPTENKSLQNILKALYNSKHQEKPLKIIRSEIGKTFYIKNNIHDWFKFTIDNGVMWLNAALTVKPEAPGSHMDKWDSFMKDLIEYIQKQNKNVTWCLWGKAAQNRFKEIEVNKLQTVHPRNISFTREENPFKDGKLAGINFLQEG